VRLERSVESTTITIGTPVVLTSPTLRGVEVIDIIHHDYSTYVLRMQSAIWVIFLTNFGVFGVILGYFSWLEGRACVIVSLLWGLVCVVADPQDLRPGLSSFAPTGLLDRGCSGNGSVLRWVVVGVG